MMVTTRLVTAGSGRVGGLGGNKIEGKHAVSWTMEFGRETSKDGDGVL